MKSEYQDYMEFLKSFVQGTPLTLSDNVDWSSIMKMAQINNTTGIIGYMFMSNPGVADPGLTSVGRHHCLQEISVFSRRAEQMKQLMKILNEHEIDHLLFKGYLVRELYPIPELRSFGDIDFVIRKEDREKCDALMMELGFTRETDWEPVYSYLKGMEYYEIHTEVLEVDVSQKADYKEYYSHIWEHVINTDQHTYVFTPEFHLLYLLTHIAKHISGAGAGIRMYIDIAFYVQHYRDTLDWNYIKEQFKILKFEDFGNIVFTAVEQWFGVASPIKLRPITEEVMDDFLSFTLEGGLFGKVGRESSVVYLKQKMDNEGHFSKGKVLMHRMFPSAADLESRYTYLQGKHCLLPIAWIHRLVKTRNKIGYHAHEAQGILKAEDEQVQKLGRMYKEIGL